MKTTSVIIVAGGSGQRMGSSTPKQFLITRGRPVLMWTIEAFGDALERIVVLPREHRNLWLDLCKEYDFRDEHILVDGGRERYDSVRNGLMAVCEEAEYIAVHDGVRPWVTNDVIRRVLEGAKCSGSATAVVGVTDTIRIVDNMGKSEVLERERLRAVQTPQIFKRDILIHSYLVKSPQETFTDDASIVEAAGYSVSLVEGDANNIKITYSKDLE